MREYAIEGHGDRMGIMKGGGGGGGGEIVQVEGGHIIRSTGRKDRHSKVYTSKGPRDRRVRLSATTAIQFYDVQDRLGFDRPSKAVDWLIKKAKSSIDRLADLPPWNPSSTSAAGATVAASSRSGEIPFQEQHDLQTEGYQVANTSSFISFTGYSVPPEMVARATHQTEDLGLSLHPLQLSSDGDVQSSSSQAIFVGTTPVDQFEPGCGHYPRLMGWGGDAGSEENRGGSGHGFLMSDGRSSALMMVNPQRGTLQSSFTGGFNESMPSGNHHHNLQPMVAAHQSSFLGARYGSESLTPFYYPARIHRGSSREEQTSIVSDQPSSSTSPSSGGH